MTVTEQCPDLLIYQGSDGDPSCLSDLLPTESSTIKDLHSIWPGDRSQTGLAETYTASDPGTDPRQVWQRQTLQYSDRMHTRTNYYLVDNLVFQDLKYVLHCWQYDLSSGHTATDHYWWRSTNADLYHRRTSHCRHLPSQATDIRSWPPDIFCMRFHMHWHKSIHTTTTVLEHQPNRFHQMTSICNIPGKMCPVLLSTDCPTS